MGLPLPTRRGVALFVVAGASVAMSATFGLRSLDAVVLPAGVALAAAVVQLAALDPPRVERTVPPAGDPGTAATVELAVRTDTPVTAVVRDRLPSGIDGEATVTALVGDGPVRYDVTYRKRGEYPIGPATVSARDVLGLARRTFDTEAHTTALVYPRVSHPSAAIEERLRGLTSTDSGSERGAFDHLREYVRGDSLRDVHWKSSAKRQDLVVQEFGSDDDRRTVTVAASAADGRADAMAEAVATVGYTLLEAGVAVALTTPDDRLHLAPGETERLLAHLARVGDGGGDDTAEVVVRATADGTTVEVGGSTLPFAVGDRRRVGSSGPARLTDDGRTQSSGSQPTPTEVRA
jgi:uncharacterized protein (DUF58 family)